MGYLSEVTRRRIAALLLVAIIVVAGLAIADVGPFSDPPTGEERRTVEQRAGSVVSQQELKGCDEILRAFLGKQLSETQIAKVVDVRVSGNQAVVDANLRSEGTKRPRPATFELFLIEGEWRIDSFQ